MRGAVPRGTSRKTEMKLTNVARASLSDELLRDYESFLTQNGQWDRVDKTHGPGCPVCGQPMLLRTAHRGPNTGQPFWGCSGYPACKRTLAIRPSDKSDSSDRSDRGFRKAP